MSNVNKCCRIRAVANPLVTLALALSASIAFNAPAQVTETIARVKPSIVAVGTINNTRSPSTIFTGTGFVVADGRHVITNAHVVSKELDLARKETLVVLIGENREPRDAQIAVIDANHDLALLAISGEPLPAMKLGDSARVREGQTLLFTGFPIAMALGFHPATHRGMVAAITPVVEAGLSAKQLNARVITRLRQPAYTVFQLDGTAYPGNSGSPLYDPETGLVYGIINMVFVKGTKEAAISNPSGITYAIPGNHIVDLLRNRSLEP